MGSGGSFQFGDVKKLQKQLEQMERERNKFCEDCAKHLAARLLAKIIKRTPVGQYPKGSGQTGGTLRRGWTAQASGSGSEGLKTRGAAQYADTAKVNHFGDTYVVEITNSTEYGSYVEFGHRTANHKGWVPGRFMMTISEQELQSQAPAIVEKRLADWLKGVFSV